MYMECVHEFVHAVWCPINLDLMNLPNALIVCTSFDSIYHSCHGVYSYSA